VFGLEPLIAATVIRFDPGRVRPRRSVEPYEREPIGSRRTPKDLYVSTRVLRTDALPGWTKGPNLVRGPTPTSFVFVVSSARSAAQWWWRVGCGAR
jgi:hypothetical protein